MSFHLRIATLERVVFDEDIESVSLRGSEGDLTILPGHTPLITAMKAGEITARHKGEDFYMFSSGGVAEIQPHRALILADVAERADEIDEKRAEEARERAIAIMQEKRDDEAAFGQAEAALQRALLRLRIAHKHRSKRGSPTI